MPNPTRKRNRKNTVFGDRRGELIESFAGRRVNRCDSLNSINSTTSAYGAKTQRSQDMSKS